MDNSEPRIFIALKIDLTEKNRILIEKLKSSFAKSKIRWTSEDNYHLTLKFLGEIPAYFINSIELLLTQTLSEFSEFNFELKGLGTFGGNKPKVIWMGIQATDVLNSLQNRIDDTLVELGFEKEKRPFSPHLTLGRIKYLKDPAYFSQVIQEYQNKPFQIININKIVLFESFLKSEGPVYKSLKEFNL